MKQYLIFNVDGTKYGLDTKEVLRLVAVSEISKVPQIPKGCIGVTTIDRSIYAIYDAGYLLSKKPIGLDETKKFILLNYEKTGLLVEAVNEVMDIEDASIQTVTLSEFLKEKVALVNKDIIVMVSAEELIRKVKSDKKEE